MSEKPTTERVKFANKCDECGKLMNEGYVIYGGERHYCSEECALEHFTKEEWDEMMAIADTDAGDSYWTEWEDPDEYQYWEDGTEVDFE